MTSPGRKTRTDRTRLSRTEGGSGHRRTQSDGQTIAEASNGERQVVPHMEGDGQSIAQVCVVGQEGVKTYAPLRRRAEVRASRHMQEQARMRPCKDHQWKARMRHVGRYPLATRCLQPGRVRTSHVQRHALSHIISRVRRRSRAQRTTTSLEERRRRRTRREE